MDTMVESVGDTVNPRILRTRRLLQHALQKLLKEKDFDKISVQDITDAATVNRVTFYDHYTDKFALLECMVGSRFQDLLTDRGIRFDCSSALNAIVLAVCDYLAGTDWMESQRDRQMVHLESAVIAVVRRMFLEGFRRHPSASSTPPEMIATTLSWAIYGAAQEWVRQPDRCSSEEIVGTIATLVSPILNVARS